MRLCVLSLALLAALAAPAHAEDGPASSTAADDQVKAMDRVVVIATRTKRALADVPNTVDDIDRAQMDARQVHDLKELFRYEPGITVTNGFGRFGIGDIRVRGLGGNRVRIQTDGIVVPDAFSIGSFSNANRNFVDLETVKRVEVVRGPTSSLYGSDALGGTVAFVTRDPEDYLSGGKRSHVGVKLGFDGAWDGRFAGATVAQAGERWSGMLAASFREGHEAKNQATVGGTGSKRTLPNPQDRDGRSLLGKLVFTPNAQQRWRLTLEHNEDSADTEMLTSLGLNAMTGATNTQVTAHDTQARTRVSLGQDWALDSAWADTIDWQMYRQNSRTMQYTYEARDLRAPTLKDVRERWFHFDQTILGLQLNTQKSLQVGSVTHDFAYGVDFAQTKTEQRRDGLRSFPLTGVSTPVMPPDTYPVRDFPLSTTRNSALYVQDEIGINDGKLRIVPAIRVDHYELSPKLDPIFEAGNPGVAVMGLRKTSVSPKLGAVWHFQPDWSVFASFARGFRSPPYADVNIGFTNVQMGYTAVANPNLKPETSFGSEMGLRYTGQRTYASLSGYDNRYHDFIESFMFVGMTSEGLMAYQSQNVAKARIYGAELKAGVELGKGWSLRGAAALSRGEDQTANQPLESVDPLTASLGLAYDAERWGMELASRFSGQRSRVPEAVPGTQYYQSPGYGVVDFYAHWTPIPRLELGLGVRNLTDRTYWMAGDIPLVSSNSATLDRYTGAGRTLSASLAWSW